MSFDRVLLVHGLEVADHTRRLLREIWRVLDDSGRLLVVAPNRTGMWAHAESTPFGHGQPYSPGQVGRLLAGSMFRVERRATALFVPPSQRRVVWRGTRLWESVGHRLAPGLAGLTLTEAMKDIYAAMPVEAARRRRVVMVNAG